MLIQLVILDPRMWVYADMLGGIRSVHGSCEAFIVGGQCNTLL